MIVTHLNHFVPEFFASAMCIRHIYECIQLHRYIVCVVGFVCFVALRPKSTAMVMAGLTTLFPGQA